MLAPSPAPATYNARVQAMLRRLDDAESRLADEAADLIRELAAAIKPPENIVVSLENNTAWRLGKMTVCLSPNQASMLFKLSESYPRIVSVAELSRAIYGAKPPRSINTIRTMVMTLRERIIPLGVTIQNQNGRGYRLELLPQPE